LSIAPIIKNEVGILIGRIGGTDFQSTPSVGRVTLKVGAH
jgi:hypothetical protein